MSQADGVSGMTPRGMMLLNNYHKDRYSTSLTVVHKGDVGW